MKNIFTLALLFALNLPLFSQANLAITHKDYGDGLIIQMDENLAFDLNEDGEDDFFLNSQTGALDFTPLFGRGCFASTGAYNNIGSQMISQFEENDFIAINNSNIFDYADYDPVAPFIVNQGLDDDWIDMADTYVGFAVFNGSVVSNGWMKIALDISNQTMILKEMAYTEFSSQEGGGIHAGDRGLGTSLNDLSDQLSDVTIFPNPTRDQVQISFDYNASKNLQLQIVNGIGLTVFASDLSNTATTTLNLETSDWIPGTYFIQLKNEDGVNTSRLVIE